MEEHKYDILKLENQLCVPLYTASREIIKLYTQPLERFDLTYTQYIVMLTLWEYQELNLHTLGEKLHLDNGTLNPVIRKLIQKGYVQKTRSTDDERIVMITLTEKGIQLKDYALDIPKEVGSCVSIDIEKAFQLRELLHELIETLDKRSEEKEL